MAGRLNFYYDKAGDILDISIGRPRKAISKEVGNDILVRVSPETNEIVGLIVLNFEERFSKSKHQQRLPLKAEFVTA